MCVLVDALIALGTEGVPPPVNGSAEDYAAVQRVNAQLSQRRVTIMGLDQLHEMGC